MLNRTLDAPPANDAFPATPVPPRLPRARSDTSGPYATLIADSEHSVVNERLTMNGDLDTDADILVKGKVYGNIRCKLLIVDTSARVEGCVEADDVIVRGTTKGKIIAKRVRLEKTADVASDIHHASFCAEEGARIRGAMEYSENPRQTVAALKNAAQVDQATADDIPKN